MTDIGDIERAAIATEPPACVAAAVALLEDAATQAEGGRTPNVSTLDASLVDLLPHVEKAERAENVKRLRLAAGAASDAAKAGKVQELALRVTEARSVVTSLAGSPVELLSVAEMAAPIEHPGYPVTDFPFTVGAITLCSGYSQAGKTVGLLDLALAVAGPEDAKPWCALRCQHSRVLVMDWEMGSALTRDMLDRLARPRGFSRFVDMTGDRLSLAFPAAQRRAPPFYLTRVDDRGRGQVARETEEALCRVFDGFGLALLDSYAASCPGMDENATEAGQPLYMLGRVSERTGCAIILTHHMAKGSLDKGRPRDQQKDSRSGARGSGAILGAAGYGYNITGDRRGPKLVQQAKNRGLGDPPRDDFYWIQETVDVREPNADMSWRGYFNRKNPLDPGGFRVSMRTKEAVEIKEAKREAQAHLRRRVLDLVHRETSAGRIVPSGNAIVAALKEQRQGAERGPVFDALKVLVAEAKLAAAGLPTKTGAPTGPFTLGPKGRVDLETKEE